MLLALLKSCEHRTRTVRNASKTEKAKIGNVAVSNEDRRYLLCSSCRSSWLSLAAALVSSESRSAGRDAGVDTTSLYVASHCRALPDTTELRNAPSPCQFLSQFNKECWKRPPKAIYTQDNKKIAPSHRSSSTARSAASNSCSTPRQTPSAGEPPASPPTRSPASPSTASPPSTRHLGHPHPGPTPTPESAHRARCCDDGNLSALSEVPALTGEGEGDPAFPVGGSGDGSSGRGGGGIAGRVPEPLLLQPLSAEEGAER